ncbi:APC family permease [Planktosalinus lacus]|uniref:Amino acid transporter n=1 Tax=Planktosalinus lacus TaxID=1526573 RepID=A0A8J2Y8K5_9FLAO|nr:amino acid permease [Planktosalinus lacus]GGD93841.1 amino acid transporter [Planktosalinus lacus]
MKNNKLKKVLGFWDLLFFGVGSIVGAGIYAIIGEAAALSGNLLWLSFVLAAVVALLTGLSYSEFVSRFPDAGGSFEYIKQSMGMKTALFMSFFMAFTGIVAAAAIALSFADYLGRLTDISWRIIVVGIIFFMTAFNTIGSKMSSYFNSLATIITLLGLVFVIVVSLPNFENTNLLEATESGWHGIFAGSALIFFSYIGFEDLVKMAEETNKPKTNMPKAIILSSVIVLILYVFIAISALGTLHWKTLSTSGGPLAEVIESEIGSVGATLLIVVALFATSKTILSNILGTSRLFYDVARDSKIANLKKLTILLGPGKTPVYAIALIGLLSLSFAMVGNLKVVASISNVFIFIVFGMVNLALLKFRLSHKEKEHEQPPFRVPFNIKNIPVPTVLALLSTLVFFGYNIYNILEGF